MALHKNLLQATAATAISSRGRLELQQETVQAGATSQRKAVFARPCFISADLRWS